MNNQMSIENVLKLDNQSEEFREVLYKILDRSWEVEKTDDLTMAEKALVQWAYKGEPDKVILSVKVINEIFRMQLEKVKAIKGHLCFCDTDYYFDIYESEPKKDEIDNFFRKIDVNKLKDKYGKKYF